MNKDLIIKIQEALKTKCWKTGNDNLFALVDEPITFNIMDDIKHQVEMMVKRVKCAIALTGQLIGESDLKREYEEFKTTVDNIMMNEMVKCAQKDDLKERFM